MDRKQLENVCKRLYENSHVDLTDCDLFSSLIKEHFDSTKQTAEFNKFKLHSDSTLKLMKKDELISYIHMLYHNWSVADERAENIKEYCKKIQEKETPKKVIELSKRDRGYKHICPSCEQLVGTIVLERYHNGYEPSYIEEDEYCSSCGQRLDWRDDNG